MKKINFFVLIALICSANAFAQSNVSAPMSFHIERDFRPPFLSVTEGSVRFVDANGNNLINANEECSIAFSITNTGKGDAHNCTAKVEGEGTTSGLSYKSKQLPRIKAGESYDIVIPISSSMYTATGNVVFTISVDEPNGFGTDPVQLTIGTRKFDAPFIEIVSYKILSDGDSELRKKKPFKLQVLLQNTDQGMAENVKCSFTLPENMFLLDGERVQHFASLAPNEKQLLEFELQSNANVDDNLDIHFALSESWGKYAKNADIPLHFGQAISSGMTSIQVAGNDRERVAITKGSLVSDVDENIPDAGRINDNTFAVIIANENYQQVASVPFALNDGAIFKEYCAKTLGIPQQHIHYVANATGNNIKEQVNWLQDVLKLYPKAKVVFYYAGHGIPDELDKTAYLLPVDGSAMDITTGYKLDDLYQNLNALNTQSVTVLLDACFSGAKREEGMLASARGVALKVKSGQPIGNMVVLSAAQGTETAYPFVDQQHGMFTYFLLKKLQESKGNVNLEDLGNYIIINVGQQSIVQNRKSQTPCVIPSAEVGSDWKTWTLK